ncbi:MAG: signal peptidase I [Candidatus Latescibacter sp.]|nr:signal peptidase I [Candidatus Latescibacter sp.]
MNSSEKNTNNKNYKGFHKFRKDWIEPLLIAVILVTIIKMFFFQNFKIPSSSMEDTLLVGDYLFAVKFLYGTKIPFTHKVIWKIRDPRPDDIIVFKSVEEKKDLIKRCIAVGGQTVEIRNAQVFVEGVLKPLPKHAKITDLRVIPEGAEMGQRDNIRPFKVPDGKLFMMGDNRDNSYDSRFWGFLPMENVKGKALFLYWSWDNTVPFYNLIYKVRWNRLLTQIR